MLNHKNPKLFVRVEQCLLRYYNIMIFFNNPRCSWQSREFELSVIAKKNKETAKEKAQKKRV